MFTKEGLIKQPKGRQLEFKCELPESPPNQL